MAGLAVHELADDELTHYRERIEAVTIEDVGRIARERIDLERLAIVIVGDADQLRADLEAAGVGAIEVERDEGPTQEGATPTLEEEIGPVDSEPEAPPPDAAADDNPLKDPGGARRRPSRLINDGGLRLTPARFGPHPRAAAPAGRDASIEAIRADAGRWRFLPALASPLYRRFIAGALVANLGTWMQQTAQGWLVLTLTNSPALLGVTSAAANLPILLFSLHAGALADRVDLRRLLVASRLAAAGLTAVLALLTTLGVVQFWQVVTVAFLVGAATAVGSPAYQAVMSSLVEPRMLGNAIALNSAQFNLSRIVGPSIAGIAIAAVGVAAAFWANTIGFLFSAATLATIPPARRPPMLHSLSLWSNVIAGIRFVRRDPIVLTLLLLPLAPGVLNLNYLVLLPVFARDVLGVGAPGLGLMTAAVGVGAVTGALSIAVLRPGGGSGRLVLGGLLASSAGLLLFSLSPWLPLSMVGLAVLGCFSTTYYTTTNTLLQLIVPGTDARPGDVAVHPDLDRFHPAREHPRRRDRRTDRRADDAVRDGPITLAVCAFVVLRVPSLLSLDADGIRASQAGVETVARRRFLIFAFRGRCRRAPVKPFRPAVPRTRWHGR